LYLSCFLLLLDSSIAQNEIDSLKNELAKNDPDTNRVWVYRDLAYYYMEKDLDTSLFYSEKGVSLARRLGFNAGIVWNQYQQALAFEFKNQFDEALEVYSDAIHLARSTRDTISLAKLKNAIGAAYYFQSQFDRSLQHYHEALDISSSIGYYEGMGHALNNLGIIFKQRRNFQKALDAYQQSLEIKTHQGDTAGMVNSYYNIGLLHSYTNAFESSLNAFSTAEHLSEHIHKKERGLAAIQIGKGVALYHLNKYDEAEKHLQAGIPYLGKDLIAEKAAAKAYLGMLKIRAGNNGSSGMTDLQEAWNMVENSDRLELKKQIIKELATAYEWLDQPKKAIESWKIFTGINDSINNEQKQWAFEEMQARFDAIEKDKLIHLQAKELEKAKASSKNNSLYGVFSAVFIFLTGGLYWYRKKKTVPGRPKTESFFHPSPSPSQFNPLKVNGRLLTPLTKREIEIIQLVEKGHTNQEIARNLFVSENTVKTHLKNIFSKTDAHNRTDLVHKIRNH
jgi:DNA-binding CsgD family transcriptional regulator/tetratricopeptide (TPR) repeat protein